MEKVGRNHVISTLKSHSLTFLSAGVKIGSPDLFITATRLFFPVYKSNKTPWYRSLFKHDCWASLDGIFMHDIRIISASHTALGTATWLSA